MIDQKVPRKQKTKSIKIQVIWFHAMKFVGTMQANY